MYSTVDCGLCTYIFFPKEKDMKNGQEIILVYICQHNSQNKTQKIVQKMFQTYLNNLY